MKSLGFLLLLDGQKAYPNSAEIGQSPEWFYSAFNHPQRLDITYANSNFMQELMIKGSITDGRSIPFLKRFHSRISSINSSGMIISVTLIVSG